MDPLSIAAGIIALIQATNKVVSICYDYRAAAKDSTWELPRVIEEIRKLRDVLETLEKLAAEMDTAGPEAKARLPTLQLLCKPRDGDEGGLLDMCLEELKGLRDKLAPPRWMGPEGSRRRAVGQALRWPLNRSDTNKMLEAMGRFRDMLNLALTADQATLILKIEDSVQAIKESSTSVHEELGKLTASFKVREVDEHLRRIHMWLEAPDPSANHVFALGKRESKTGSWFIGGKHFASWKNDENSFLWLHGIPGCGKTILSSTIIQAVHEHCTLKSYPDRRPSVSPIWAVAYFYFDFSDTLKQDYNKMIRSLVKQLSEQLHYTSDALEKLFTTSTSGSGQPPSDETLLKTLGEIIEEFDQVYIILDALDECKERMSILDCLSEMNEWDHSMLHILVTSRKENDIANELESFTTEEQRILIHKNFIETDIRAYIYSRLRADRNLKRWRADKQVQLTIANKLTEKADGMFRWAACQLDELKTCFSRRDLQIALESLPKDLDDTYAQILCRIDEDRSETVLKILQWLAYSARPLQIDEVADIIAVQVNKKPRIDIEARFLEPRDILTLCSSLVTTNLDASGTSFGTAVGEQIKLAHLSVKDYLTSKRILTGKAKHYSIQEMRAHEDIAQICLAYLLQFDEPIPKSVEADEEYYPLARYAAEYWAHHVRASGRESEEVVLLSMELLNSPLAFENWIRLFDSDRASPEGQLTAQDPEEMAEPLYYASQSGLQEPVRLLLAQGAKPSRYGGIYGHALQAAAAAGFRETVKILLEGGADRLGIDVDAQGGAHNNALQAACAEGYLKVVEVLLSKKANVNIEGGIYANPLQAAAAGGHHEIVKRLVEEKAEVNAYGGQYSTALIAASFAGHDKVVEILLDDGAEIELSDKQGRTPLSQAASEGHTSTVKLLLKKGADVNHEDNEGWGPLDEASPGGHYASVVALLDAGAKIDSIDRDGNTALHFTASQPHPSVVRLLLERGASQRIANSAGALPMHDAAWAGRHANLEILIEFGASVNEWSHFAWTPLHASVAGSHEKVTSLLLDNGAVFIVDGAGWTALHIAILVGNENMVKLLLERGADLSAADNEGYTSTQWASFTEEQIAKLQYQLRYKQKSSFTVTGLRIAASQGENVRIRGLLKSGADVDAKDDGGWSALLWAAFEGHHSTMQLLIKSGADVNTKNDGGNTIIDCIENWRDDATLELVDEKFDYEALVEQKRLLEEKRARIRDLLSDWEKRKESIHVEETPPPPYEE